MEHSERAASIAEYLNGLKTSRFSISIPCFRTLKLDHISFNQAYTNELSGSFVCRILVNYCNYARDNFKKDFTESALLYISENSRYSLQKNYSGGIDVTKELKNLLSFFDFDNALSSRSFKERLSELHFGKREVSSNALKEKISQLTPPGRESSKRFRFSSRLFSYILEQFSGMDKYERERIYCYEQYKTIAECIEKNKLLRIRNDSGKLFEMKPWLCTADENISSYYAVGYSRPFGSTGPFECHSNKLIRISECSISGGSFSLSLKELRKIRMLCDRFGPAYIMDVDPEDIRLTKVTLTEYGYRHLFLKFIAHQRPLPAGMPEEKREDEKTLYVLYFDCSHNQLRNYFRAFGDEAVIDFEYRNSPAGERNIRNDDIDNHD